MTGPRRIDFEAIREARLRLRRLAAEHPELVENGSAEAATETWLATLAELEDNGLLEETSEMAEKKLTAFRLPEDMLEQLDRVAEKLTSEQPGMSYTRADAVRILLARGITAELGSKDTRPVRKVAKGAKREE